MGSQYELHVCALTGLLHALQRWVGAPCAATGRGRSSHCGAALRSFSMLVAQHGAAAVMYAGVCNPYLVAVARVCCSSGSLIDWSR